jgi:polyferredoxin
MLKILRQLKRIHFQAVFFLLQNPLLPNFLSGEIYQGRAKRICTPGLNCYSCPAAITSCPVGALQLFFAGVKFSISLFVTGFLLTIGLIFGRYICGYVCPFGFFQDLLYKIKTPKLKLKRFMGSAVYIKYIILILFVIVLPFVIRHELSGLGSPWFCKYICPAGTIFGALPILHSNEALRSLLGQQFILKAVIAGIVVIMSVFVFRPFCRVLCPLGAIYSFFNRFSIFRMGCGGGSDSKNKTSLEHKCNSCRGCHTHRT